MLSLNRLNGTADGSVVIRVTMSATMLVNSVCSVLANPSGRNSTLCTSRLFMTLNPGPIPTCFTMTGVSHRGPPNATPKASVGPWPPGGLGPRCTVMRANWSGALRVELSSPVTGSTVMPELFDDHRWIGSVSVSTWTNVSSPALGAVNGDQFVMSQTTPSSKMAITLNRMPLLPDRTVIGSGETHIAVMVWCTYTRIRIARSGSPGSVTVAVIRNERSRGWSGGSADRTVTWPVWPSTVTPKLAGCPTNEARNDTWTPAGGELAVNTCSVPSLALSSSLSSWSSRGDTRPGSRWMSRPAMLAQRMPVSVTWSSQSIRPDRPNSATSGRDTAGPPGPSATTMLNGLTMTGQAPPEFLPVTDL